MPIWLSSVAGVGYGPSGTSIPDGNAVRTGIEFDPYGRRVAYHLYRENPGETMFYPISGLQFMRVRGDDVLHVYKPWQAGLLRGQPHLSSVLVLLHEIGKCMDASVVKKQIQTMFAAFIQKASPDGEVLPPNMASAGGSPGPLSGIGVGWTPPGTVISDIETGTIQNLFPGEEIKFPQLPAENDLASFMSIALHQFALAIGMTYEQVTGDLRGVNLSSIRAGVLDFRRKAEQFVYNILIAQFGVPIVQWWMDEAVLSGQLKLPGYAKDPDRYQDIDWYLSGWDYIDPKTDVEADQAEVRNGFTSREAVCAKRGVDVTVIDAATVRDNARADQMGLVHDSDPRRVLLGRESNPQAPAPEETPEGVKEVEEAEGSGGKQQGAEGE
jgi:lambda family phage portal protein